MSKLGSFCLNFFIALFSITIALTLLLVFENENKENRLEMLEEQVNYLQQQNIKTWQKFDSLDSELVNIHNKITAKTGEVLTMKATAYTQSVEEGTADGITATGTRVKAGRTIAVDPDFIPLGSRLYVIAGKYSGEYIAEDVGGAVNGKRLDIFMRSKKEAFKFGRREVKVVLLEEA